MIEKELYMSDEYTIEFLTVKEFADKMHMTEQVIRLWIKTGKIKAMKVSDGPKAHYRIPTSELYRLHALVYENKEK
jgi:excisionase family DNA binding protein